jgi:hypothetical protein
MKRLLAGIIVFAFIIVGCSSAETPAPTATTAPAATPADQDTEAPSGLSAVMLEPEVYGDDWYQESSTPVDNAARASELPDSDEAATKLVDAGRQDGLRQILRMSTNLEKASFGLVEVSTLISAYEDSDGAKAAFDYIVAGREANESETVDDIGDETYVDVTSPDVVGPTQYSFYVLFIQGNHVVEMVAQSVDEREALDTVLEQANVLASNVSNLE